MTIREYMALRVQEDREMQARIDARTRRLRGMQAPQIIIDQSEQASRRIARSLAFYDVTGIYARIGLDELRRWLTLRSAVGVYRKAQDLSLACLDEMILQSAPGRDSEDTDGIQDEGGDRVRALRDLIEDELTRLHTYSDRTDVMDSIWSRRYSVTHENRTGVVAVGVCITFAVWYMVMTLSWWWTMPVLHLLGYVSVYLIGVLRGDKSARSV